MQYFMYINGENENERNYSEINREGKNWGNDN